MRRPPVPPLGLTAGQAHDGRSADGMSETVGPGQTLPTDAAHDSNRLRDQPESVGAKAVIRPIPRRAAPPPPDRDAWRRRNRIERFFLKLEHFPTSAPFGQISGFEQRRISAWSKPPRSEDETEIRNIEGCR